MPAASTSTPPVQVLGFDDNGRLTRCSRLLCDSCSSGQCFACGFLQIPPRGGHPCRPASGSPCRAHRGLAPPSHPASTTCTGTAPVKALRAMPGAPQKNRAAHAARFFMAGGQIHARREKSGLERRNYCPFVIFEDEVLHFLGLQGVGQLLHGFAVLVVRTGHQDVHVR